jgi:GcrA cell cycle regulator
MNAQMQWWSDGNREARLTAAVAAGMPYPQIAAMLGITKNAAIGKAYRLGLCKEASSAPPRYAFNEIGPCDCCWPLGHPGDPDFHFCGVPAVSDRPYCAVHVAKAYIRL